MVDGTTIVKNTADNFLATMEFDTSGEVGLGQPTTAMVLEYGL